MNRSVGRKVVVIRLLGFRGRGGGFGRRRLFLGESDEAGDDESLSMDSRRVHPLVGWRWGRKREKERCGGKGDEKMERTHFWSQATMLILTSYFENMGISRRKLKCVAVYGAKQRCACTE